MTKPDLSVNYRNRTTMPIHDMVTNTIVCLVDIYGWTKADVAVVPGGTEPLRRAIERLGLDPERYQPYIMDIGQYELGDYQHKEQP